MNDLCMKRIWKSHRIVTVCYDANANTISKHNAIVLDFQNKYLKNTNKLIYMLLIINIVSSISSSNMLKYVCVYVHVIDIMSLLS